MRPVLTGLPVSLVALAWSTVPALAIDRHRGVSLDIWTPWPNEQRWDEPGFLDTFPEWRKTVSMGTIRPLKEAASISCALPSILPRSCGIRARKDPNRHV